MKPIRFLLVIILLTIGNVMMSHGQTATPDKTKQTGKEKIKKENLPAAAIRLLDSDAFKGWTITQVYREKVKDDKGKETADYQYDVEVKKDTLLQTLKFDKDGNAR
jgi:hypothetical protein